MVAGSRQGSRSRVGQVLLGLGLAGLVLITAACDSIRGGDTPDVQTLLASALEDQLAGQTDAARSSYNKVLEEEPYNPVALYNLGVMAQLDGLNVDAERFYRAALITDPNFSAALYNLAILRTAAGAEEEAIVLYRQVVTIDPTNAAAHFNLGFLLEANGSASEGRAEIQQAIELDPTLEERIPPQ